MNSKTLKKTPFYKYHLEAGAKMVPFAGYEMPVQYKGITAEHLAVRKNVGLFDLSHMGEFEISGGDALAFIQKMTTNDASDLNPGQIQYSCMCYEDGGIVDDLLVYRLDDKYMLVVNAANLDKDFAWLEDHLEGDVKLVNKSGDIGLLAVQGPNAQKVMEETSAYDFESLPYYHSAVVPFGKHEVLLSRTGYTGEDGFELYIPNDICDDLWEIVYNAGEKHDIELIGLGARDSLRLEMKMSLYGNDIDKTTTPLEAGLSFIVKLDKGDFIGKEALARQKADKPDRKLVCLELEEKSFPRKGYDLVSNGETVGQVTSGTFSPSLNRPIALGYVPRKISKSGNRIKVRIRDKLIPAVVVKQPFYKEGTHR